MAEEYVAQQCGVILVNYRAKSRETPALGNMYLRYLKPTSLSL